MRSAPFWNPNLGMGLSLLDDQLRAFIVAAYTTECFTNVRNQDPLDPRSTRYTGGHLAKIQWAKAKALCISISMICISRCKVPGHLTQFGRREYATCWCL